MKRKSNILRALSYMFCVLMIIVSLPVMSVAALDKGTNANILVNGQSKEFSVGSTITYSVELTSPANLEDIMGYVAYDASVLQLEKTASKETFPVIGSSVLYNDTEDGYVFFSVSNLLGGFDFTDAKMMLYRLNRLDLLTFIAMFATSK